MKKGVPFESYTVFSFFLNRRKKWIRTIRGISQSQNNVVFYIKHLYEDDIIRFKIP